MLGVERVNGPVYRGEYTKGGTDHLVVVLRSRSTSSAVLHNLHICISSRLQWRPVKASGLAPREHGAHINNGSY